MPAGGRAGEASFGNADSDGWNKRNRRESGVGAAKFQLLQQVQGLGMCSCVSQKVEWSLRSLNPHYFPVRGRIRGHIPISGH